MITMTIWLQFGSESKGKTSICAQRITILKQLKFGLFFTYDHDLAINHSLNIALVKLEVVLGLYHENAVQYALINHNLDYLM